MPITIGIIDDHPLFREGVARSLAETSDFIVVAEGADTADAARIAGINKPDVILLDVSMPGDGLAAIEPVLTASPETKIIMLTASEETDALKKALQSGAVGYVLKGVGSKGLAEAIRSVASGAKYIAPTMAAKIMENGWSSQAQGWNALTPRELEVIELVAQGLSNKHIAIRLDLQEKTVKHHMTQILSKTGTTNRTEAALLWHDRH
jgi:two-component system, NarL family, nitrate/nitrite response regulator NarL